MPIYNLIVEVGTEVNLPVSGVFASDLNASVSTEVNLPLMSFEMDELLPDARTGVFPDMESLEFCPLGIQGPIRVDAYAGLRPYGSGTSAYADVDAGIARSVRGEAIAGIAADAIAPPTNPLCVHLGNGVVLFGWTPPSFADPSQLQYEIFACESLNGTYIDIATQLAGNRTILRSIPVGITAYFQIRTVLPSGFRSTFAQCKLGRVVQSSFRMNIRSIAESYITKGAIFSMIDQATGSIIAFQTNSTIDIVN